MLASLRLKLSAAAAVVLLHVGFYQWLSHPLDASGTKGPLREVMRVEFIERARPAEPAPAPLREAAAPAAPRQARRAPSPPTQPGPDAVEPAPQALSARPLVMDWKQAEPSTPGYRPNLPEHEDPGELAVAPADRIRMRRQLGGKEVIEGTAQMLGLWPPGYESDPCLRVQRNIAQAMTDGRPEGRERLGEELRRQRKACRR